MTATSDAQKVAALRAKPFLAKLAYAVKPASWPKLFAPTLLGQAIGASDARTFSLSGFLLGVAFTTLDVVYVVLLNDWGDRDVDAIKRRRFPDGCSPKTIPDGILPASTLLAVGVGAGTILLGFAASLGPPLGRPAFLPLAFASLLLFAIYTFKPIALNYRGGGELLEMLGVGLVLPWLNAYLQSGSLVPRQTPTFWILAPALAFLALASALASGISDEESDREGGKRTFATMFGNARVRGWVVQSYVAGTVLLSAASAIHARDGGLWFLAGVLPLLAYLPSIRRTSPFAVTNAFKAQNTFKGKLHLGLWASQLFLGTSLVVKTLSIVIW